MESNGGAFQEGDNGPKSRIPVVPGSVTQVEAEWIEKYEPGVYITLVALRDGTRDLKRVRFSRRRFGEHQAETWWSENEEKVYERCKAAKNVTAQDMAERLPPGAYDTDSIKLPNGVEQNGLHHNNVNGDNHTSSHLGDITSADGASATNELPSMAYSRDSQSDVRVPNGNVEVQARSSGASEGGMESNGLKPRIPVVPGSVTQVEAEWIEQYEPGVYITLVALRDGTRVVKRVRFSRRRFGEHQTETWWSENREKVYERYNVRGSDKSSVSGQAALRSEGNLSPSSL